MTKKINQIQLVSSGVSSTCCDGFVICLTEAMFMRTKKQVHISKYVFYVYQSVSEFALSPVGK